MAFEFPKLSTYQWSCADESKQFVVENPATGQVITTIQAGDASTAEQAVHAGQQAFQERWGNLTATERSRYLFRCAESLEKHADELATLLCMENGKPVQDARIMVGTHLFLGSRLQGI